MPVITLLQPEDTGAESLVIINGNFSELNDAIEAGGTVSSVSVATDNGFAGSVANPTSTPEITLETTVTGILEGDGTGVSAASTTGSGAVVLATSPTLVTPTLGVASATSINKVAITAPATSATLTIPDGVTMTGPASSGTVATLGNTETFTGAKTFTKQVQTIVAVAALALDGTAGNIFTKTIGTGSTFTQSGFSTGQCFLVKVTGAFTVTWFAGVTWITSGAAVPTQAAVTTYGFVCTGSNTFDGYLVGTQ